MLCVTADLDFPTRKMNAAQAYHEWMPIRDTPSNFYAINRTLQFGMYIAPYASNRLPLHSVINAMMLEYCCQQHPSIWCAQQSSRQ